MYESELAETGRVHRVVSEDSEVRIFVYRDGRLAKLGHNHVIVSRDVRGFLFLADDSGASRADLFFPVTSLVVDDPDDRTSAGSDFATELSPEAVAGTRRNLLGERVLDAQRFPFVVAGATATDGAPDRPNLAAELTVKDAVITVPLHADMVVAEDRVEITGTLQIAQTEFGIEPYSVLGGALRVRDQLDLHFRVVAVRIGE